MEKGIIPRASIVALLNKAAGKATTFLFIIPHSHYSLREFFIIRFYIIYTAAITFMNKIIKFLATPIY